MARGIAVTATITLVVPNQDGRPAVTTNILTRIFPTRHLRELTRDNHHQGGGLARKKTRRIVIMLKTIMSRLPIASLNGGGTVLSVGGTALSGSGTVPRPNPYRDFLKSGHLPLLLLAPLGLPRLLRLVHDHVNLVRMTNPNLTSRCLFKLPTSTLQIFSISQTHFFLHCIKLEGRAIISLNAVVRPFQPPKGNSRIRPFRRARVFRSVARPTLHQIVVFQWRRGPVKDAFIAW